MKKETYLQILRRAREIYADFPQTDTDGDFHPLTAVDVSMWDKATGRSKLPDSRDPSWRYDLFLAAFILNESMDSLYRTDDVVAYEYWTDRDDRIVFANAGVQNHVGWEGVRNRDWSVSGSGSCFLFSARMEGGGQLPMKKATGWHFGLFVDKEGDPAQYRGRLFVNYKGREDVLTETPQPICQCQKMLIAFLLAVEDITAA